MQKLAELVQASGPTPPVIFDLLLVRQQFVGQLHFGRAMAVVKLESYQSSFKAVIKPFSIGAETVITPS